MVDADIFLGLSAGGVVKPEMVKNMADRPLILATANPEPEIRPELAKAVRPDAICATGRSDYPNQVNNSLCFPFIFRGALDCGATTINEEMKLAAVRALAEIAQAEPSEIVAAAYGERTPAFGPADLIPRAFDPRLIVKMAPAVAKAAVDSGVATRPTMDLDAYRQRLSRFVYRSGTPMEPVFEAAKKARKRVVYAEGEDERVLRAAQVVVDEGLARPLLIGREEVIAARIESFGLRLQVGQDCECVNVLNDARYAEAWKDYYAIAKRWGVTRDWAQQEMRTRSTLIGAMLVRRGDAEAMLCGTAGAYAKHLKYIREVIGLRVGVKTLAAMQMLILPERQLFICDTHINLDPSVEQIAEMTLLAAVEVRQFGVSPSVALLSHSSFGSSEAASAQKMRDALGDDSAERSCARRGWARCAAMPRSRRPFWMTYSPNRISRPKRISLSCPTWMPRILPSICLGSAPEEGLP